jgi:hypothetical protein
MKEQGETWTVFYHANNGKTYKRTNVLFYKIQEALMDLSREAYEKGTYAERIEMR